MSSNVIKVNNSKNNDSRLHYYTLHKLHTTIHKNILLKLKFLGRIRDCWYNGIVYSFYFNTSNGGEK
jgi:hypothetical protein